MDWHKPSGDNIPPDGTRVLLWVLGSHGLRDFFDVDIVGNRNSPEPWSNYIASFVVAWATPNPPEVN